MISLTRLNDAPFVLNCDLIETITENPDTTITLTTGNLYIVKEPLEVVTKKIIAYKQEVFKHLLGK